MDCSDTSSEDEDQKARLQDAIGDSAVIKNLYSKPEKKEDKKKVASLPSLRPDKEKETPIEDTDYADLTKGAKDFVARKLSEYLESELDTSNKWASISGQTEIPDEGIRLFKSSKCLMTSVDSEEKELLPRRRKRVSSSEDSDLEEERLKEAAVTSDFIVKQSQDSLPVQKKEADLVIIKTTENNEGEVNTHSDRKKKKKKKKSKSEDVT